MSAWNPWTATVEQALEAQASHVWGAGPDPLMQYVAAQDVLALRPRCQAPDGGPAVLQAIALCISHGLVAPNWLATAFARRHAAVVTADAKDWTDTKAFGDYWPPHARMAAERKKLAIHAEVCRQVASGRSIGREMFADVGGMDGVHVTAARAEACYYEALASGLPRAVRDPDYLEVGQL